MSWRPDLNNPEDKAFLMSRIDKKTGKPLMQVLLEANQQSAKKQNEMLDKAEKSQTKKKRTSEETKRIFPKRIEQVEKIRLTLDYPLSVNAIYATRKSDGKRVLTKAGRAWKQKARVDAINQGVFLLTGEVILSLLLYRPRKSGDTSNRIKIVEDALTGLAYTDDEQVADIHIYRRLDRNKPRIEIIIKQKPL